MEMMRYWLTHGKPAQMTTLPQGVVRIQDRGSQTVDINGKPVKVERYSVQGLIWGMEVLWMDSSNNLAALVSTDAEFDHFEAVRDDYEPALSSFVASAAHDEMALLTELSTSFAGRRTGTFAFVGATVVDVTGKPPIPNATIVTSGGKIVAVGPSSSCQDSARRAAHRRYRQVHHPRPVGHARPLRAGGMGTDLPRCGSYHSEGRRQRVRLHHPGARRREQRQGAWSAHAARRNCRWRWTHCASASTA